MHQLLKINKIKTYSKSAINHKSISKNGANRPRFLNGFFGISIDPVDGSSNVKVNRTVGTIVGIYDERGRIICGFYALYGIFTNLVIAVDNKVAEFILDTSPYSMTFFHYIFHLLSMN